MVARGKPSAYYSFTSEVVFEYIYLHLILLNYLDTEDLAILNYLNILFEHMCKMIKRMKPYCVYEIFEHDKNYVSQEEIPFKRKMQFPFLALINRLKIPAVIRSLRGNHNALHRNPDEIIAKREQALDKGLLEQLKRIISNNNPSKFKGHTNKEQRNENRAYRNHSSITKNMKKVENNEKRRET